MKEFIKKQSTFILYGFVFWLPVILVIYIGALFSVMAKRWGKQFWGLWCRINFYTPVWGLFFAF